MNLQSRLAKLEVAFGGNGNGHNGHDDRADLVRWVELITQVDEAIAVPASKRNAWGGRFLQREHIADLVYAWGSTLADELGWSDGHAPLTAEHRALLAEWRTACTVHTWPMLPTATVDDLKLMLAYMIDWHTALTLGVKAMHSPRCGILEDEAEAQAQSEALHRLSFTWCVGGWTYEGLLALDWSKAPDYPDSYPVVFLRRFCQTWQHLMKEPV
jgi:hypothetical protein